MKYQPLRHIPTPMGHHNSKQWIYKVACSCGWNGKPTLAQKDIYSDFTRHLASL